MLDGPIEIRLDASGPSVKVYRKVFEDGHDSYATVGSEYAESHPDDVTEEKIEQLLDHNHENAREKWDERSKQMWRELFDAFGEVL